MIRKPSTRATSLAAAALVALTRRVAIVNLAIMKVSRLPFLGMLVQAVVLKPWYLYLRDMMY